MSTHIFPLGGPIDPPCSICNKTRSEIERADALVRRIATIKNTIKVQLAGVGLSIVDKSKFDRGYGDYALLIGDELDRAVEMMARNILQVITLEES